MPFALAANGLGVYVASRFSSATVGFGSTTLTNASASSMTDVFVAKLLAAGSSAYFSWAQRTGGFNDGKASGLTIKGSTLYVGSMLTPAATFGSQTVMAPTDIPITFLASLTDLALVTTSPAWAASL